MIKRVEVASAYSNAPEFPLSYGFMPNDDPVQIKDINGLGPVKSEVASTPWATSRGELFQGSSTGKRNIVLTVGLNPNWADQTITSLRQLLYRYFMAESWVTLRFFTDELPVVKITGVVESFEPNIFSEDPEMQISILCHKPDFVDVDTTLIYGVVDSSIEVYIDYQGTVSTGFDLRVESAPALAAYTGDMDITNQAAGESQVFQLQAVTINSAQYLQLGTVRTTRYVHNVTVPAGDKIDILAKMITVSDWVELSPGGNVLKVAAASPGQQWTLAYFNRFGGL